MNDDSKDICYFCGEDIIISREYPRCIHCGKKVFYTEEEREKLKQQKEEQKKKHEEELKQKQKLYEEAQKESLYNEEMKKRDEEYNKIFSKYKSSGDAPLKTLKPKFKIMSKDL